jgi:hypothetical protein
MSMSSKVNRREAPDRGAEEYLKGRRAGVEGSYGEAHDGVAERTVVSAIGNGLGGGEDGLEATAKSLYGQAVRNTGDKLGDKALMER